MRRTLLIVGLLWGGCGAGIGQTSVIDSLLIQIAALQVETKNAYYDAGLFPSQRVYRSRNMPTREDDNIFFTGLIAWTLKSVRADLSAENQVMVDTILSHAARNYPRYQSKSGRPVYNFWQTDPSRHFPNSAYFSSRKKYIIPDDLDDTAILYLATDGSDSLKAIVRRLMAENANGNKFRIRNTFRRYKKVPAYSTWFGKNMPVDFDLCVQANGLRFVLDNDFELNRYDSATFRLIRDMVGRNKHLKRPAYVAPHYQDPAIILYHLARLVAPYAAHPLLSDLKPLLIADLKNQLDRTGSGMRRILLESSLLRLGTSLTTSKSQVTESDLNNFYFFVANMTSVFTNPIKGLLVKSRKTNFFYRCRAYYLTLILEHEILSRAPLG